MKRWPTVDVLKPLQQTGDISPTGLGVVLKSWYVSLRTASQKVGTFPYLAIAAASDQVGVPELQRRNGVLVSSLQVTLVTHRGRFAWKTPFWDDIFSKTYWLSGIWFPEFFDMVPNMESSLKHWWYHHAQQAVRIPKGTGIEPVISDFTQWILGMICLEGRCNGKVDSTKSWKIWCNIPGSIFGPMELDPKRYPKSKTTKANRECFSASPCSRGCRYLLTSSTMISISQIATYPLSIRPLNDILIPPSPYPSTNPISVKLLVLLKFAHLHSFGQIKKPHLKTDGKTDCKCVGFGLVECGMGTMGTM